MKWCPGGGSLPKLCASGTKGNLTGLANCFACEAGTYQDSPGQSDCKDCELGGYCTESTVVPTRCAPGTFGNRTSRKVQADCFLCPAGSACVLGAEEASLCPSGTFANTSGMSDCTPCEAGSYQTRGGQTECEMCVTGSFCPERSAAPSPCDAGTFGNRTRNKAQADCHACPPGSACSVGSAAPIACGAGSFMPNASAHICAVCPPGTYQPSQGEVDCLPCLPGKFCEAGVAQPSLCPGGTYGDATDLTAAEECASCAAGFACAPGSTEPKSCPPSSYAPNASMDECEICTPGKYNSQPEQLECLTCGQGTYCPKGSSSPLPCQGGTYSRAVGVGDKEECLECPVGFACSTGSVEPTRCNPGTYADVGRLASCNLCNQGEYQPAYESTSCLPCPMASYCPTGGASSPNPCPGGTYSNRTGLIEKLSCTSVVVDEWAPTGSSQPEPCPASGFRCPGRSADDVNEVPGSKPILVDSGATTEEVEVETVTFDLALALSPSDWHADPRMEQQVIRELAALYGVNASLISLEASISDRRRRLTTALAPAAAAPALASRLTTTTLATLAYAAAISDTEDHRRRLSSLILTVTILVPTPESDATADEVAGEGGSSQQGDSQSAAEDGESAGYLPPVDMKAKAALFAAQISQLNAGNNTLGTFGVCALLFNATGATSTVSEPEVKTEIKEVSVACPMGYWCSAGLTVQCVAGSYNNLLDQNNAGACTLCPANTDSIMAATSSRDCKCVADFFAAILPLVDQDGIEIGPDCQLCPNPGSNCTNEGGAPGLEILHLPLATNYWRVTERSVDVRKCPVNAAGQSACLGGMGVRLPDGNVTYCRNGTAGPLCALCIGEGEYIDKTTSTCMPCGQYDNSIMIIFPLVLLGMSPFAVMLIMWARKNRRVRDRHGRL